MVWALAVTETISYGVLCYSFAAFLLPMRQSLGFSQTTLTGTFSLSVLVTGAGAIPAGAWLDRHGARALMTAGSLLAAGCVLLWARAGDVLGLYLGFTGIGLAGAAVLYEPAFATVNAYFDTQRQQALLTLTMVREHVHYDDAGRAELRAAVPPYQRVRSIDEDVRAGELLLAAGHRLRAVDVAAAAAAGATILSVRKKALVLILPTGDEVRPIGTPTGPGKILDTNSLMLAEQAREAGCEARCLPIEPDDPERITAVVEKAAAECDLLIVIAGSSAGRDDYTARVVASAGTLAVHGVAVRPGHPVVLGVVGRTPVLGAPGYPVSAALTFDIFAAPLLAELSGAPPRQRPHASARLARKGTTPGLRYPSNCCAGLTRSRAPSSRSGRTTWCSTWPRRSCAPTTRW